MALSLIYTNLCRCAMVRVFARKLKLFRMDLIPTSEETVSKRKRKKRKRTVISPDEMKILEEFFKTEHRPDRLVKLHIAKELGKTESFINIWFQNRRARERKLSKLKHIQSPLKQILKMQAGANQVGPVQRAPLFRRMVYMAAASEGGILSLDSPDVNTAITDACKGITLKDGRLSYDPAYGLDVSELTM